MSDNSNITAVKTIYDFFSKGNIQGVIDMLDPAVVWIIASIKNYPPSGTHKGKDEVLKFFSSLGQYVEILSFEPQIFCGSGNTVFVKGHYEFKAKSTGKIISSDWIEMFVFDNGKIQQYQEFTDTAAFQNAFS